MGQEGRKIRTLSGGMKRRVMIAKALAHEPQILFLDEPTAGVDVELRKDMWQLVRELRAAGVTIILTTHYIEEAEDMADRVGVINQRRDHPGRGQGRADAQARQEAVDARSARTARRRAAGARELQARARRRRQRSSSTPTTRKASAPASRRCLTICAMPASSFNDLQTTQSSLEDIFVGLVKAGAHNERLRRARDLQFRDGAHRADAVAEHRFAGDLDLALFHRVRRRDRLAHHPDRRRQPTAPSSCRG